MKNAHKKDQILSSFLDFLYIQKGLTNNTAYSYQNDLLDYALILIKLTLKLVN